MIGAWARSLPGHEVKAVGKLGWGQLKDDSLLAKAQAQFEVLVTSDKNLPFQQDLRQFALAVAVLDVPSNRIEDCLPKMPTLLKIKDMIEALETRGGCYLWENVKAEASTWRAKSKSNCQSDRAVR